MIRDSSLTQLGILVFFGCFLLSVLLSYPTIIINDDWITANQLAQLDAGHQVLFTEGKYGAYENGTSYRYFTFRHNILQYTLFLPVFSYIPLQLIKVTGNYYPFFMAILFSFLLLISGLLIRRNFSWSAGKYLEIGNICIIGSIIVYYLNMILARPFIVSGPDEKREILAVVLAHQVSFALLGVVVFLIFLTISKEKIFSIFGTISCLFCSSFLFWATNLKDHIETTLIFTIIVYLVLRFYLDTRLKYALFSFLVTGILVWARPELGTMVFFAVCLLYLYIIVKIRQSLLMTPKMKVFLVIIPLSIVVGLIPFFFTNYMVTGHPLITAMQYSSAHPELFLSNGTDTQDLSQIFSSNVTPVNSILNSLFNRLTPGSDEIFGSIYRVGLQPSIVSVPVFLVTPLFFIGLLLAPLLRIFGISKLQSRERNIIVILGVFASFCLLAYISSLEGLIASLSMMPDIRYLLPVYIPLTIIGIMLLRPLIYGFEKNILKLLAIVIIMGLPLVFLLLQTITQTDPYETMIIINSYYLYVAYVFTFISFVTAALSLVHIIHPRWFPIVISVTIAFVFLWQVALVLSLKLNPYWVGYPMVLPVMDSVTTAFLSNPDVIYNQTMINQ